jgi:entericidin B
MEQQVKDHQHERRDAQQPSQYVFAHDRSPIELSNDELALASCAERHMRTERRSSLPHCKNCACDVESCSHRIEPCPQTVVPALDPEAASSTRLARVMHKARRVQAQETVLNRNGVTIMMRKLFTAFLLGAFVLGMAGCNTMRGAGQDISKGGQKLENSAERNKNKP